jgi:hypothetical protein
VKKEEASQQPKAPAAQPAAPAASKQEDAKQEPKPEPSKPAAAKPAPVKAEAADSSDSDDDMPLASRKPAGTAQHMYGHLLRAAGR